jgi:hypothetical protein
MVAGFTLRSVRPRGWGDSSPGKAGGVLVGLPPAPPVPGPGASAILDVVTDKSARKEGFPSLSPEVIPGEQGPDCPRCGAAGVPVLYGFPMGDGLFEARERGEIVLGGCQPRPENTACRTCRVRWWTNREDHWPPDAVAAWVT